MSAESPSRTLAPRIGDRVEIDISIMGETIPLEVVVVQVDDEGPRGIRIIGQPEGAHSAFARHQWRTVVVSP